MPLLRGLFMSDERAFTVPDYVSKEIVNRQNGFCKGCEVRLDKDLIIQHQIPKSLGGTNSVDNLIALCKKCQGYIPKSIRMPNHLFARYQIWTEENGISSSFSTIIRDLLSKAIDGGDHLHEEVRFQENTIKQLIQRIHYLETQLLQKQKALDKINRLSR